MLGGMLKPYTLSLVAIGCALSGCDVLYTDCISVPIRSEHTAEDFKRLVSGAASAAGFMPSRYSSEVYPSWEGSESNTHLEVWASAERVGAELSDIAGFWKASEYKTLYKALESGVRAKYDSNEIKEGGECALK